MARGFITATILFVAVMGGQSFRHDVEKANVLLNELDNQESKTVEKVEQWTLTNSGQCNAIPLQQAIAADQGAFEGINQLLEDPTILAVAYGEPFIGQGQVPAWKYDAETQMVWSFWAKPACLELTFSGDCKNTPGAMSCDACPSCHSKTTFGVPSGCDLPNSGSKKLTTFAPGATVALGKFGSGIITNVGGNWRLTSPDGKTLEKPIYTCKTGAFSVEPVMHWA